MFYFPFFNWPRFNFDKAHEKIKNKNNANIEIVATPRSSLANEKNKIIFWHNWVANQLKNRPFYNITIKIYPLGMG